MTEPITPPDYAALYPEHQKLNAIGDQSQTIGEFLDWLGDEKGYSLGRWGDGLAWPAESQDRMYPVYDRQTDLLAEFFEIDLKLIEQEKRAMLESMRAAQDAADRGEQ